LKKILIIGPLFYNYCKSIARAFEQQGYEVELIEWVELSIENFKEKVQFNIAKNKDEFFEQKKLRLNKGYQKKYTEYQPDLVFVVRGSMLTKETLELMQTSKLVLWMMDSVFLVKETLANIKMYHHIFLFEKVDIPRLENEYGLQPHFLPLSLDETVYFPLLQQNKQIDILFVGALYPERVEVLKRLIKAFPGKRIQIYGNYFSKLRNLKRYFFRDDKKYFTNSILRPDQLNVLYSKARVCINIHHSQSVYGVNQRFFELTGAKALQVCDNRGFIKDNFDEKDVFIYNNEEELHTLVASALDPANDFSSAINSAYNNVIANHTFNNRIAELLSLI
jgi:spore maturation protein CgeB